MANQEHLEILLGGNVDKWNKWREENPDIVPDLSETEICGRETKRVYDMETRTVCGDAMYYEYVIPPNLVGVNLAGADLHGTEITADLRGADFSRASLAGSILAGAIDGANFRNADLSGVKLKTGYCSRVFLVGADLRGIRFYGADFSEANLSGVNFSYSYLVRADFRCSLLQRADFRHANLCGASFKEADLKGADFRQVTIDEGMGDRGLRLINADIRGVDFRGIDLSTIDAIDLRGARLDGIVIDRDQLPHIATGLGINIGGSQQATIKEGGKLWMTRLF